MGLLILLPLSLLYYAGVIIYRLYFHPLCHIPGPRLAAASTWYELYYDLVRDGDLVFQIQKLHEKYGPVVRVSPNEVHVNDLKFYHEMFKQNTPFLKDKEFYNRLTQPHALISIFDPTEHRKRRELFSPFFSKRAMYALDVFLWGKVEKFCRGITEANGEPIKIGDAFHCFSVDIISEYLFGKSFNMLDEPNFNGGHIRNMEKLIQSLPLIKHFGFLKSAALLLPDSLAAKVAPAFLRMYKLSDGIVSDLMRSRSEPDTPKDDTSKKPLVGGEEVFQLKHKTIYDALLDNNNLANKGRKALTKRELIDESMVFLSAGTDTVSNALVFTVYYILSNPDVKEKLLQELMRCQELHGETPSLKVLEKLPYLTGVIREGLRLSQGVPGKLPRLVPSSGAQVSDIYIPPGTIIGMGNYFINMNPEIYPEPSKFLPERWINNPPPEKWFVPFSKGSRSCVGMDLAWADCYLSLTALFTRFDLELYETGPKQMEWRDYAVPFLREHPRVTAILRK